MIAAIKRHYTRRWHSWVKKRHLPGNTQPIDSRNLYILPSAFGWAYGVIVFILLIGAINYQINTIFLMTFLLAIIGMASAVEAHANLLNMASTFIEVEDSEQGTPAKMTLLLDANSKSRYAIHYGVVNQVDKRIEMIAPPGLQVTLLIATNRRGCFPLPPVKITSSFPFGIFTVWHYAFFDDQHYYVYPQAVDPGFWPDPCADQYQGKKNKMGDEELYELKQVQNPWLEPKLISWKIAAKGQGWYLKKMNSNETDRWLFKLDDSPADDIELKLQHLSYWLQAAEANGLVYALALTETTTTFARGKDHLQHCLRLLAQYA